MKKIILFFLIFLLTSNLSFSFYSLTTYSSLIEKSDLIVCGKIIEVNKLTFEIKIQKIIKGKYSKDNLLINKFINWSCSNRISEYEIGQEAIYFLKCKKNTSEIIGEGNEGELLKNKNGYCIENINHKKEQFFLDEQIILEGINDYLFYQTKIKDEFENYFSRTKVFTNSILDNLFNINEFFKLVIIQKNEFENHKLN